MDMDMLALSGQETTVLDEFAQSLRASITNTDTCPPKAWNDAYDDLSRGLPVDCTGAKYVDEDTEEDEDHAEPQAEGKTTRTGKNQDLPLPRLLTPLAPCNAHRTAPCILRDPQHRGTKSEVAASPLPSRGPKRGRKCYGTLAFSGVPYGRGQKRKWPTKGRKCYVTPAF